MAARYEEDEHFRHCRGCHQIFPDLAALLDHVCDLISDVDMEEVARDNGEQYAISDDLEVASSADEKLTDKNSFQELLKPKYILVPTTHPTLLPHQEDIKQYDLGRFADPKEPLLQEKDPLATSLLDEQPLDVHPEVTAGPSGEQAGELPGPVVKVPHFLQRHDQNGDLQNADNGDDDVFEQQSNAGEYDNQPPQDLNDFGHLPDPGQVLPAVCVPQHLPAPYQPFNPMLMIMNMQIEGQQIDEAERIMMISPECARQMRSAVRFKHDLLAVELFPHYYGQ